MKPLSASMVPEMNLGDLPLPGLARIKHIHLVRNVIFTNQLRAVRRPGIVRPSALRSVGRLPQPAAVRSDQPGLILAATVRHECDPLSVGRKPRVSIVRLFVGELPLAGPIGTTDPDVELTAARVVDQPPAVRRNVHMRKVSGAPNHRIRRSGDRASRGIERDLLNACGFSERRVGHQPPIGRDAQMTAVGRRRGQGLGRPEDSSRVFVERDPPQVHAPAPIAGEIHETSVWRPGGTPIEGRVRRQRCRLAAVRRDGPDVPLASTSAFSLHGPIDDALSVRRPVRLKAPFNVRQSASLASCQRNRPKLAG